MRTPCDFSKDVVQQCAESFLGNMPDSFQVQIWDNFPVVSCALVCGEFLRKKRVSCAFSRSILQHHLGSTLVYASSEHLLVILLFEHLQTSWIHESPSEVGVEIL